MSSDHRDGRTMSFFFHLNNETSLYLFKHEVNKRDFIFECIWRWPITNLVTLIYGYSYLISLETDVGYRKLRSSRNPGQFKCVLEKPDITYPSRNS